MARDSFEVSKKFFVSNARDNHNYARYVKTKLFKHLPSTGVFLGGGVGLIEGCF